MPLEYVLSVELPTYYRVLEYFIKEQDKNDLKEQTVPRIKENIIEIIDAMDK